MMPSFYLGLDLGQQKDYTALSIVEPVSPPPQEVMDDLWPYRVATLPSEAQVPALHVRHLERFTLGTKYPAIVDRVGQRMRALAADTLLVVDATGVGRPVVDMFVKAELEPMAITITGGTTPSRDGHDWRVPKRDLVSTLQVVLQTGRLKVAKDLPEASILVQELLNFQVKITDAANDTYGAWREGTHDDLVLAVAMAVWVAEYQRQQTIAPLDPEIADFLMHYRGWTV